MFFKPELRWNVRQWSGLFPPAGFWPFRLAARSRFEGPCRRHQRPRRTSTRSRGKQLGRGREWQPKKEHLIHSKLQLLSNSLLL